jgi:hypothetical protein
MNSIYMLPYECGVETNPYGRTPSEKIKALLDKATEFMAHTKDPSHGIDHLNKMLKDADRFFQSMGDRFAIDKEILLLSIYWHDVWKSQHKPGMGNYLFQQLYEGWGSMLMFRKWARVVDLSSNVTRAVSYAIRRHSAIPLRPAKTLEAQLLWDIDTLDLWNSKRTKVLFKDLSWANISLLDSYLLYMKKVGFPLHFEWTRNEVNRIKPSFFREMLKFRESLIDGSQSQPLVMQTKPVSTKWNLNNKS